VYTQKRKIDYQSLAYELIKTWKYEVGNKAGNSRKKALSRNLQASIY
jgi:hypothetical protein